MVHEAQHPAFSALGHVDKQAIGGEAHAVSDSVVAVVTTKNRPALLRRLADAVRNSGVTAIFVNDNAGVCEPIGGAEYSGPPVVYVTAGRDLGCGGGLGYAMQQALQRTDAKFFWILDDDAVPEPGALAALREAQAATGAGLVSSAITNGEGIQIFSGPMEPERWKTLKSGLPKPDEFLERFGPEPMRVNWSSWVSMLVTREAVERAGLPRDDYWFQGEDLEFAMRIIAQARGYWAPGSVCAHLPPPPADPVAARRTGFLKYCALVQNTTFTFLHLKHGRPALRHLPGNYMRFFRYFGFTLRNVAIAARLFWFGAVRGEPAGHSSFQSLFREQLRA